jgi:hypothetical protein
VLFQATITDLTIPQPTKAGIIPHNGGSEKCALQPSKKPNTPRQSSITPMMNATPIQILSNIFILVFLTQFYIKMEFSYIIRKSLILTPRRITKDAAFIYRTIETAA